MPISTASVIDAHQHFLEMSKHLYAWCNPDNGVLRKNFLPEDFHRAKDSTPVTQSIAIQADPSVAETLYLLDLAKQNDFILGVVGWVDLEHPKHAVMQVKQLCEDARFLGIRPMLQDMPDVEWILRRELDSVFEALIANNLCFEALVRTEHLKSIRLLAQRHPELRIVIDHGAKPDIATETWQPWAREIELTARQTKAFCKVSGLVTEAKAEASANDIKPYLDHLISAFGVDRLLWGSDWPVVLMNSDYQQWWAMTESLLRELGREQRQKILEHNAMRAYDLTEVVDESAQG